MVANAISRPSDSFLLGDKFAAHQLAVNEVYCQARKGKGLEKATHLHWRPGTEPVAPSVPIIPDVYFEIRTPEFIRPVFLEVDLGTEGLPVWSKKIEAYLSLASSGEFERIFTRPRFAVAVVTNSEKRMQSLRSHIAKFTSKLFYFSTMQRIKAEGFWSRIWLRPDQDQPQSLI